MRLQLRLFAWPVSNVGSSMLLQDFGTMAGRCLQKPLLALCLDTCTVTSQVISNIRDGGQLRSSKH